MTGRRLETGGLIDRDARLNFSFDGRNYAGHPGDTLASALLANGVRILGRSFKYHRPRGVWGAWFDDPNAMMNVALGRDELPNCPATTTALVNGMRARGQRLAQCSARYQGRARPLSPLAGGWVLLQDLHVARLASL